MDEKYDITSEQQFETLIGQPYELTREKILPALDQPMRDFIIRSPLLFLATWDASGRPDISPKGDASGFVQFDEIGRLLIPDRPGNQLAFGFRNILGNPDVGLIFVAPHLRETLRIKGRASLTYDPALLERLRAQGKPATLCTRIEVDECFFHCAMAMVRSRIWRPEEWADPGESLLVRQIASRKSLGDDGVKIVETSLEQNHLDKLY